LTFFSQKRVDFLRKERYKKLIFRKQNPPWRGKNQEKKEIT